MATETQSARPMSRGRLLLATVGSLIVGALIVVGAILPAEYNVDPLGVGRLSGLSRLWAPGEKEVDPNAGNLRRAREYPVAWRTDVIEIPLNETTAGMKESALEYKVFMQKDATLIYSWEVVGEVQPRDFIFDQHGHTVPKDRSEQMTVSTYKQSFGLKQNGALTAPFDGIQGWLFQNNGPKPVIVKLHLAGFYELIPLGDPGNESRVRANVPAAQARPDTPFKAP